MWSITNTDVIPDKLAGFLRRVLPWGSGFVGLHVTTPKWAKGKRRIERGGSGPVFTNLDAEYGEILRWIATYNRDGEDVFFCLSTRTTYKTDQHGRKRSSRSKRVNQPVQLKAFWLDLDIKDGAYATLQAALKAALAFLDGIGLKPSAIVKTGGGLHVYIILEQGIPAAEWLPLALAWVAAARKAGIKGDLGLSKDDDRILRLPTSFNNKIENNPRPVEVTYLADHDVTLASFREAVAPWIGLTPEVGGRPAATFVLDPAIFPRRPSITSGPVFDEVSAAQAKNRIATTPTDLAATCLVVADSERRGGNGDVEPLWKELATLCHYVDDGREFFHDLSSGDPRYVEADTDRKYDERATLGWPHCSTIAAASHHAAGLCATCRFNGQPNTSPIHHARNNTPVPPPPVQVYVNGVNGHAAPQPLPVAGIFVPSFSVPEEKYKIEMDGRIRTHAGDRDVFGWPIEHLHYRYPDGIEVTYAVSLAGRREYDTLLIRPADIASEQSARSKIRGVLPYLDYKLLCEFIMDFTTMIRRNAQLHKDNRPGWVTIDGEKIDFAFGGSQYGERYTPRGNLGSWQDAVGKFIGKGCMEIEVAIACAFASPLIALSGQDGAWVHFNSSGTGMGKSASTEISATVWGSRATVHKFGTAMASTIKAIAANNLPTYLDENITGSGRSNSKLRETLKAEILQRTAGAGRDRATRSGDLNEDDTYQSLTISSSNYSLVEAGSGNDTNAQAARVLEVPITPALLGLGLHDQTGAIKDALDRNYGQAGLVYADFLRKNITTTRAVVEACMQEFKREANFIGNEERYWLAAAGTIYAGAKIARHLGILDFDILSMRKFLLVLLRQQAVKMSQMGTNVSDPAVAMNRIIEFVNIHRGSVLVTLRMPGRGTNKEELVQNLTTLPRDRQIIGRIGLDDKVMELSEAGVRRWCNREDYGWGEMRLTLLKAGNCTTPHRLLSLSRSTNLRPHLGAEKLLRFDFNLPQNITYQSLLEGDDDELRQTVPGGEDQRAPA